MKPLLYYQDTPSLNYVHSRQNNGIYTYLSQELTVISTAMSISHSTPRATLLSTMFWEVLPSHYDKIITRWTKIAHLHHAAKSDLLATDRAGAVASIKAELTMLNQDVEEYRKLVNDIDITDIAGV
jgi:hypothetical protein